MKIKLAHSAYIAKKISLDLFENPLVYITDEKENIVDLIRSIAEKDILKEVTLEEKVEEMLDNVGEDVVDEFEYMDINYKQVFWMVKKKLASQYEFILDSEDRFNNLSHDIINALIDANYINYGMSETVLKNIIFDSIMSFIKIFHDLDGLISEKITHYKRKLIPGSDDYDLVYKKLYEEELARKGLV